jgi:ATP-dependent helicase/nuclease subunit A
MTHPSQNTLIDQLTKDACNPQLSVVVEACAGSGKTWLLVSRMLRLLLDGARPSEILAITFTRKAAQEMRGRLDELLRELATCSESKLMEELLKRGLFGDQAIELMPKARKLFEEVLSDPHPLSIDTFHGWFTRLLKGAPLGSGVPQGLSLRDDFKRLQDECLKDWWANLPSGGKQETRSAYELLVKELGAHNANQLFIGPKGFLTVKAEWWRYLEQSKWKGLHPKQAVSGCSDWLSIEDPLKKHLDNSEDLINLMSLAKHLENGGTNDKKYARAIQEALTIHAHEFSMDEIAKALRPAFLTGEFEIQKKLKASGELKKSLKGLVNAEQLEQQIDRTREAWAQILYDHYCWAADARAHRIHQAWLTVGIDMLTHYQAQKEVLRVQDFSDLEAYTAQLMLSSDMAHYLQARLDARYKHVLIDEFQDTNPLQWQIVLSWLNAYGKDESKPTVFLVGDPKQSIYRFRRADVRLFNQAKQYLENNFQAVFHPFNQTRRNSPAVLEAVNAVFQLVDVPSSYPFQVQTRNPQADDSLGHGEVVCLPLIAPPNIAIKDDRGALSDPYIDPNQEAKAQQSYEEALQVAQLIQQIKNEKNAAWSDFLVLLKSRTPLTQIERAFRSVGIPCDSPRQGGLLKTLEAEDLVALLSVLMTPTDDLALAQVLRSPIYGLSDADLMNLISQQQSSQIDSLWVLLSKPDNHCHSIYQTLSAWAELAKRLPVHDLLDHIYHQADLRRCYAQAAPVLQRDQVLSNLDAFLSLALELDGGRYPSLSRFIAELKLIKKGADEESPDEGDASGEDDTVDDESATLAESRVRVLTIHAAKGLESRFVFLMNANVNRSSRDSVSVLMSWPPGDLGPDHISPMFSAKPKDPAREVLRQNEKDIEIIENWNLLYVALTRAKEAVYISGSAAKGDQAIAPNSWYDRLIRAGIPQRDVLVQSSRKTVDAGSAISVPQEFLDFKVTWQGEVREPAYFDEELIDPERQQVIDLGVAFHAIMEHLMRAKIQSTSELPNSEELKAWLKIDSNFVEPARQCAIKILSSEKAKKFFFDENIINSWEELDISTQDGRLLRIDRLIELPQELMILDYKLSIPKPEDELYAKYALQMATYRECVARLRPDKAIKSFLLSGQGEILEMV